MANKVASAKAILAAIKTKTAELDLMDDQLMAMDSTMPAGVTSQKFDLLAEKREELEVEIRKMRERVQLMTEWDKFKNGDWSEDVKSELASLDQTITSISEGGSADMMGGMDMGMGGMPPTDPSLAAPVADPAMSAPPMDAAPVAPEAEVAPEAPAEEPMMDDSMEEPVDDTAAPLPAPTASQKTQSSKKINYQTPSKTATKGDTHMADNSKPTLKEKMAEAKTTREAIKRDAQTRVASAWTIAKTMLPEAPKTAQLAFASNLLTNSTKVLTACLRQTAVNAHNTKLAAEFKNMHKTELNQFIADGEDLASLKSAVKGEMKASPVTASTKVADDTKETGEQPKTYDDGRNGAEPKEMDGSKANERKNPGQRPGDTINLSEGKNASKKKHASCTADCKGEGCENCLEKSASSKKADEAPVAAPPAPAAPAAPEAAPMDAPPMDAPMDAPPMDDMGGGDPNGASEEILTDEKKMVVEEKIDEVQEAIKGIESELRIETDEDSTDIPELLGEGEGSEEEIEMGDEGEVAEEGIAEDGEGDELDFSKVFNADDMDEKVSSLANEEDEDEGEKTAGEEDEDFFKPTSAQEMEAGLEDDGFSNMASFFDLAGSNGDPLASLMGSVKSAAQVAGIDVVPSSTGEAAAEFENTENEAEGRDTDTDHEQDLWAEAIDAVGAPEASGQKRIPQDSKPKLEAPKKASLRRIKNVVASGDGISIGESLFSDDFGL